MADVLELEWMNFYLHSFDGDEDQPHPVFAKTSSETLFSTPTNNREYHERSSQPEIGTVRFLPLLRQSGTERGFLRGALAAYAHFEYQFTIFGSTPQGVSGHAVAARLLGAVSTSHFEPV